MLKIKSNKRILLISLLFLFGILIFVIDLGSTGLVDETPPLFAAAGRAMSESGDWLTPKVNGILRFDKPPLFYWFMAIFYSLPGNQIWDNYGTFSARIPSAMSSLVLMIVIADTFLISQRQATNKIFLTVVSSLAFALSPLIIIWSKTAVSDSLLCGTVGISLLLFWRRMICDTNQNFIFPWLFLGLAILTKGPVAIVIVFLTIFSFLLIQKDWKILIKRLKPLKGIAITLIIALPWFLILLVKEGRPFLESFFGYHNLQRYTSVVNNHSEPWWFFLFVLFLGSLPFSVFLIHGIYISIIELVKNFRKDSKNSRSLFIFSLCWISSIFVFFSLSATKLPSYWLPAIPAAAILITNSAGVVYKNQSTNKKILALTTLIFLSFFIALSLSNSWLELINDPEMPNLIEDINQFGLIKKARIISLLLTAFSLILLVFKSRKAILFLQVLFLSFPLFLIPPIRKITDLSRQLPIRNLSNKIISVRKDKEPLAMIGIRKPSLHFYSKQIVFYESNSKVGLINLSERFKDDRRINHLDRPNYESKTFLVVIDKYSNQNSHWKFINNEDLGKFGIYRLIRVRTNDLNLYASRFIKNGFQSTWRMKNFEKF